MPARQTGPCTHASVHPCRTCHEHLVKFLGISSMQRQGLELQMRRKLWCGLRPFRIITELAAQQIGSCAETLRREDYFEFGPVWRYCAGGTVFSLLHNQELLPQRERGHRPLTAGTKGGAGVVGALSCDTLSLESFQI